MPRKSDPVLGILTFFREAELAVAQTVLGIVKAEVRGRTPVAVKAKRVRGKAKPSPARGMIASTTSAPPVSPVKPSSVFNPPESLTPSVRTPPVLNVPPRRRRTKAELAAAAAAKVAPPPARKEADLALPGIGPATVGD